MKAAMLILIFGFLSNSFAQEEAVFFCRQVPGDARLQVFLNTAVYCENKRENDAALLISRKGKTYLRRGVLKRRRDERGETFVFKSEVDGEPLRGELSLPYEKGGGNLRVVFDGVLIKEERYECLMKRTLVDCSDQ